MCKTKMRSFGRYILIGLIILLTMAAYGASMGIYGETVVNGCHSVAL